MKTKRPLRSILLAALLPLAVSFPTALRASDHADGPTVAGDQAADLADSYFFLDPTDSVMGPQHVIIINTVRGFIVPGEAVNFVVFDSSIRYRFQIENNGDNTPDGFIDVSFSEKKADANGVALPQKARVAVSGKLGHTGVFKGLTTNPTLITLAPSFPAAQKLKDAQGNDTDIEFFCGETDDPFFFDIPAFARWRASIAANAKDDTKLQRGRDTFAGYNVLTIAFRVPISFLRRTPTSTRTQFGLNVLAQRQTETTVKGAKVASGPFVTVDREGLPAVNALLVPLNLKNRYNAATTEQDAAGKFVGTSNGMGGYLPNTGIVPSLLALKTDSAHIDVLAEVAVRHGDILRLDTSKPTAFPNGRKPEDDVVDTLLTLINNGGLPTDMGLNGIGDSVPENDVDFEPNFPYLGKPHQPREGASNLEDNTRN